VDSGDWETAHRSCRQAMRLATEAGATETLDELDELDERSLAGQARNQDKQAVADLMPRAKSALTAGHFERAREILSEAQWTAKRACWDEGAHEVQKTLEQVEAEERRTAFQKDGVSALSRGQVSSHFAKLFLFCGRLTLIRNRCF
jgi:hypothetical protein